MVGDLRIEARDGSVAVGKIDELHLHEAPRTRTPASFPHQVGARPHQAEAFQQRTARAALDAALALNGTAVLAGMGGVGKTQLAAEFARRRWEAGDLDLLLWVSAYSRDAIVSSYAQAAKDLILGTDGETTEQAATRFLVWLEQSGKRYLVVLDDVADAVAVQDLWPADGPGGCTIVTSRRRDATLLAGRKLVGVGVFTEQEAGGYLTARLPAELADDVEGVAADLGLLPLALSHAAAYMIDQDLTCAGYRRRFADRRRNLARLFPDEHALFDGTSRTVATTWALSIEAADRSARAGLARRVLGLAAVLDPDGIPESVFTTERAVEFTGAGLPDDAGPLDGSDVRDGLRTLHRFSLVTHRASMVRVHALVQRVVREALPPDQLTATARAAAGALVDVWPEIYRSADAQLLRSSTSAIHRTVPEALWDRAEGVHPVLLRMARSLKDGALLSVGIEFTRRLAAEADQQLGSGHLDTFVLRNRLVDHLSDAGHLEEAQMIGEAVVAEASRALAPDHPIALSARHTLGYHRGQAGHPAAAVLELGAVLDDWIRVFGRDDPTAFVIADQLAYWQGKAGDVPGAIARLQELLPVIAGALGTDHRETLQIRGNLGFWLGDAGDPDTAVVTLRAVLDDMVRVLGADHRDVSVARHNLAHWSAKAGDIAGAAAELETLLPERVQMFGPDHRDTLATRNRLAELHLLLSDTAATAAELETVLASRVTRLGADHPETMSMRHELAQLRGTMGAPATAVAELENLLTDQERVLGPDHKNTVDTRSALARWREASGAPRA
ncbi:FxSxx-COOH system tetratricopeptide repeat protein [Streptomyces sp. NPDC005784]|uniref:FxSxx-COOH system tetratricopeptide repeat protein n=1 Tax=Streptomyces sp. NPDC005784 TaxID=3364731 RepID=UPI0036CCB2CC